MKENKIHLGYKSNNLKYRILTPNGYEVFDGINKISVDRHMVIKFKGYPEIKCSVHHPFILTNGEMIKSKDITYKHRFKSIKGTTKLEYKFIKNQQIDLYDIINSGSDHIFYSNGVLSHNCEFSGSDGTLINGAKLDQLTFQHPIKELDNGRVRIYEDPDPEARYVAVCDVAEGVGLDYSTIVIMDVTQMPYKQVFAYSDNFIVPNSFATVIHQCAKRYNDALVVVESNNAGGGIVLEILWNDIEYENLLVSQIEDSKNVAGYGKRSSPGVRTTKKTKKIGCSYLKDLIETDQLIITDHKTLEEVSTFIRKGDSYEAKRNKHDDLVMTLVIFAWLTSQPYFNDVTGLESSQTLRNALGGTREDYGLLLGIKIDGTEDFYEEDIQIPEQYRSVDVMTSMLH